MPLLTKPYTILSPGEALEADTVCQDGIQASANLSYAGLLIRRHAYETARHLLDSLEKSKSAPSKEVTAMLRIWVDLETGNFTRAKTDLLDRLNRQPGNSLCLSLLQACIVMEMERQKETATRSGALRKAAEEVASAAAALSVPRLPETPHPEIVKSPTAEIAAHHIPDIQPPKKVPIPETAEGVVREAGSAAISDEVLSAYQSVLSDSQAFALEVWNDKGDYRLIEKAPGFAVPGGLAEFLRIELPGSLTESVSRLGGESVCKVSISFQNLGVATWHSPTLHVGLVTGPLAQSMITWVRTDKVFQKQNHSLLKAPG